MSETEHGADVRTGPAGPVGPAETIGSAAAADGGPTAAGAPHNGHLANGNGTAPDAAAGYAAAGAPGGLPGQRRLGSLFRRGAKPVDPAAPTQPLPTLVGVVDGIEVLDPDDPAAVAGPDGPDGPAEGDEAAARNPEPRRLAVPPLTAVLVGALLICAGFIAGAEVEQHAQTAAPVALAPSSSAKVGSSGTVTGTVTAISGDTIYVTSASGAVYTITTTDSTVVSLKQIGGPSQLRPGQSVTVTGVTASGGGISALSISASGYGGPAASAGASGEPYPPASGAGAPSGGGFGYPGIASADPQST